MTRRIGLCLFGFSLFAAGCASAPIKVAAFADPDTVSEDDPDYRLLTAEASYNVKASMAKESEEGVKQLRNGPDGAIPPLKQAIEKNDQDDRSHFALGLAYEIKGDYQKALEQYEAANRIPSEPVPDYDVSRRRVTAKIKYLKSHPRPNRSS